MEQERKVEPIGRELVRRLLPRRDPEGHKGTFGKVLCLCGSVGYTGAPVFAAQAAVRDWCFWGCRRVSGRWRR